MVKIHAKQKVGQVVTGERERKREPERIVH